MLASQKMEERSDSVFEALVTAAADGILAIDAKAHIRVFNPACARLFGYRAEEVIGKNVAMLLPVPLRNAAACETLGRRKDGSTFPVALSIGQGKSDGADISVIIIRDLAGPGATVLEAVHQNAMAQMGSSLGHELNQPLAAVMNYTKAAQRTLEPSEDWRAVKAGELLVKVGEQVARTSSIIRNFRDFIGRRETHRQDEMLAPIIEEAIALGLVGLADCNVKLDLALDPDLPPVSIDKAQIQQVVINLIRNSVDAMRRAPVRDLRITCARGEGGQIKATVSDTGCGLPQDMAGRMYQPFVTTKENGLGLGLTICQSIINAHGGRLWATPNEGAGVSFHFQLPFAEKTEE